MSSLETDIFRFIYTAFNGQNIPATFALMTPTVIWPKVFNGSLVCGFEEIRAYWTKQWSEIAPTPSQQPSPSSPTAASLWKSTKTSAT